MSNHSKPEETPLERSNNLYLAELAAFNNAREHNGISTTSRHEQTSFTDPKNLASAIIDRIKAEDAAKIDTTTEDSTYSMDDEYKRTLAATAGSVNENISIEQQYANTLAAFDKNLGVSKEQIPTSTYEVEAPRPFSAVSGMDVNETTIIPTIDEDKSSAEPAAKKASTEEKKDAFDIDKWKQSILTLDISDREKASMLSQGPDGKAEFTHNEAVPVLSAEDVLKLKKAQEEYTPETAEEANRRIDANFEKNSVEFEERLRLRDGLKSTFEAVQAIQAADASESVEALATAIADSNSSRGGDTLALTSPVEKKGWWKRNITERRANGKAAKANKADRVSRRASLKASFMKGFKNGLSNKEDSTFTVPKVKVPTIGSLTRRWQESRENARKRAEYKKINAFVKVK